MALGVVWARYRRSILLLALMVIFVATFKPEVNRWLVNFTWLAALLIWAVPMWRTDPPAKDGHFDRRHLWVLIPFVVTFAALWLPLYDNWRSSIISDSLAWFTLPYQAANRGLARSILSVDGVADLFTYTELIVVNFLMFAVAPTFFWHRMGNLLISVTSLTAIYTFFSLVLEFPWALAITIATAGTWQFQVMSHASWHHVDSYICAYFALSAFTLILRDPERRTRWLALGIVAGLSLFFTALAWAEVTACGLAIGVWALYRRKFAPLAVCGVSFLIAGLPVLMQVHQFAGSAGEHAAVAWDWGYWRILLREFLWLPAGGQLSAVRYNGHVASWPCGHFYFAGLGIAVLCLVPWVRRHLRLPVAVPGLLGLFLLDISFMTATNNLLGAPSAGRIHHLIPLQVFFALLPFYTVALAVRASSFAYRTVTVTAFLAVAAYVVVNATFIIVPTRYDGNVFDGMVQVHQRFPDRTVLVLAEEPGIKAEVDDPNSVINMVYDVSKTVKVVQAIPQDWSGSILCYYDHLENNREQFNRATSAYHLRRIGLFDNMELVCFDREGP
jgi:hypothetical protein